MLTNTLKILDTFKTKFFARIYLMNDKKISQKYFRADVRCVSDPLTCWLCICVLTQGFLGISVTLRFAVYNSRKQLTPEAHIFVRSVANFISILEMQKKIEKIIFDFEIFAFELVALDTLFYWETIHFTVCQYVNKESQDFR